VEETFSVSNINLEWVLLLKVWGRQSTVYCRELQSVVCVCGCVSSY